jgi:hypothetical protein
METLNIFHRKITTFFGNILVLHSFPQFLDGCGPALHLPRPPVPVEISGVDVEKNDLGKSRSSGAGDSLFLYLIPGIIGLGILFRKIHRSLSGEELHPISDQIQGRERVKDGYPLHPYYLVSSE